MSELRCHCDHCPNSTCVTGGLCWAQVRLSPEGDQLERSYNCFSQESPLMQSLVCAQEEPATAPAILRCCANRDYCNLAADLLPSEAETRHLLAKLERRPPRLSRAPASQPESALELKVALLVLAGLVLMLTAAYARSLCRGRRRARAHKAAGKGEAEGDASSLASSEPLLDRAPPSPPINLAYQPSALNHPDPLRGPWMAEEVVRGRSQSSFQMTAGSGDPLSKPETSSGSGSGQPFLTQRSVAHDIELHEMVGRGYFGVVWRAEYKGQPVAVKIFASTAEPNWEREVEIYQTSLLRHRNILGFIASDKLADEGETSFWLVTDFYPMGSLSDFLRSHSLELPDALRLAFSLANGLAHLHVEIFGTRGKPAIAHRDLKSKNVLVKNDGTCCIADLGMAVRFNSNTGIVDVPSTTRVGTRRYLAPELLDEKLNLMDFEAVKATDVYALALVLWEILRRTCFSAAGSLTHKLDASGDSLELEQQQQQPAEQQQVSLEELASVCEPYESPYQEFLFKDPTMDEMRLLVCEQKMRPSQSARWARFAPMRDYVTLMRECWYEKPQARLSALRAKKSLADLAQRYYELNLEYD